MVSISTPQQPVAATPLGLTISSVSVPGYVRVDTAVYYNHDLQTHNWLHAKQVNFAINLRNIFDQGYIESRFSTTQLFFGEPRTVLATVGLRF